MFFVIAIGYFFDILGRRITLCTCVFLQSLTLFFMPMAAPDVFPIVYILRIIFAIASTGPLCSPLINDYIDKGSRGRANALLILGF